ncbi:hypothetical protein B0T25DRAFT_359980 [Lasiosphaeria hispida]|uniref:Uncharacterized protein n=1 Tax=Lasiosphaeria hispida TaxID=260671 RepID=A0AAJ0H7T6_9PEZI|nr:hypothetical protein B0T25DRAFT_359980 [Lasiosphaeria hispida]
MKLSTISTALAAFGITSISAAPTDNQSPALDKRVGTDWSLKAYGSGGGTCSNAFTLFQGTATRGCRNFGSTITAINIITDVDCVITTYGQADCPRGTGTAYGPNVATCVSTAVQSFRVDCGVV